tara:strand:+ start:4479 stop:4871 length:393 start_codon:yes stop_codon:yes gene_type:complete
MRIFELLTDDVETINRDWLEDNRLVLISYIGEQQEFPMRRDFAYTHQNDDGSLSIVFSPQIKEASEERMVGLIRHELAHALFLLEGEEDHSEQDADDLAEEVFGTPIRYDRMNVQTIGSGVTPRPKHLPK